MRMTRSGLFFMLARFSLLVIPAEAKIQLLI